MAKLGRFKDIRILLGVSGSIAAYKAILILRRLMMEGAEVRVVLTRSAQKFVTSLTFETISGQKAFSGLFEEKDQIPHLELAESSDLILIAPATANIIGKIASGVADDLLTTILIATRAPVIIAPAMDGHMWTNPRLRKNLSILREMGYQVVPPEEGYLASGKEGVGRLALEETILASVAERLEHRQDLRGEVVIVTAGPTREPVDPVRYISNRSSGKMGYAIARAASERGARVILVTGPTSLTPPPGVEVAQVETAGQMMNSVLGVLPESTVLVMAAAVSDYRPRKIQKKKVKKTDGPLSLDLETTPDILKKVGETYQTKEKAPILVGFAAETEDLIIRSKRKLEEKYLDLIVANDVSQQGAGFDSDTNIVTMIDRTGHVEALPLLPKSEVARRVLDRVREIMNRGRRQEGLTPSVGERRQEP